MTIWPILFPLILVIFIYQRTSVSAVEFSVAGWMFSRFQTNHPACCRSRSMLKQPWGVIFANLSLYWQVFWCTEARWKARLPRFIDIFSTDHLHSYLLQIIEIMEYRAQLFDYLKNRMVAIAPNLTALVGELVGARLIAHAGLSIIRFYFWNTNIYHFSYSSHF